MDLLHPQQRARGKTRRQLLHIRKRCKFLPMACSSLRQGAMQNLNQRQEEFLTLKWLILNIPPEMWAPSLRPFTICLLKPSGGSFQYRFHTALPSRVKHCPLKESRDSCKRSSETTQTPHTQTCSVQTSSWLNGAFLDKQVEEEKLFSNHSLK